MSILLKKQKGLSFFEVILSVALLALLSATTIPVAMDYYNSMIFENTKRQFVFDYQKARSYSAQRSTSWAILIDDDGQKYTVYANITVINGSGINGGEIETQINLVGQTIFKIDTGQRWIYSFDADSNLNVWRDNGSGTFVDQGNNNYCILALEEASLDGVDFKMNQLNSNILATACSGNCITASCTAVSQICGDGMIVAGEVCDDWNTNSGDGCAGTGSSCTAGTRVACEADNCFWNVISSSCEENPCQVEDGFACSGEPSICLPYCEYDEQKYDLCAFK